MKSCAQCCVTHDCARVDMACSMHIVLYINVEAHLQARASVHSGKVASGGA